MHPSAVEFSSWFEFSKRIIWSRKNELLIGRFKNRKRGILSWAETHYVATWMYTSAVCPRIELIVRVRTKLSFDMIISSSFLALYECFRFWKLFVFLWSLLISEAMRLQISSSSFSLWDVTCIDEEKKGKYVSKRPKCITSSTSSAFLVLSCHFRKYTIGSHHKSLLLENHFASLHTEQRQM